MRLARNSDRGGSMRHPQRWAIVQGDEDNTDIEDGDGSGSNPPTGCGDDCAPAA
ncbi:hypothetical protein [Streptomyces sp. NPDC002994]|uniref:hypothetical protein n=1 Tax=Streptomyces sp. NPDC002994 TaxID=3154441 RepID=UPI0033B26949